MSHKKEGFVFKKSCSLSLISILPNLFQCYFSLSEWRVCVFYLFTPYLSACFVVLLSFIKSRQQIRGFY